MSSLTSFDALLRVRHRAPSGRIQRPSHQPDPRSPTCALRRVPAQQTELLTQSEWVDPLWCRSALPTFISGGSA